MEKEAPGTSRTERITVTAVMLILGIAYLALVAYTFSGGIDLTASPGLESLLHAVVIGTAVGYVYFSISIFRNNPGNPNALPFLVFACLFALPVLMGRTLGLWALTLGPASPLYAWLEFYGGISVSRTLEMLSWTLLFPLSMLSLAFMFLAQKSRSGQVAGIVSVLSAACCFTAFFYILFPRMTLLWIGLTGWGALFLIMLITYLYGLLIREISV